MKHFEVGNLFLGKYKIISVTSYCPQSHKKGHLFLLSNTNKNGIQNSAEKKEVSLHKSMTSNASISHDLEEDKDSDDYRYELDNKENTLNYMHVYNLEYSYRIKTQDMFSIDERIGVLIFLFLMTGNLKNIFYFQTYSVRLCCSIP